MIQVRPSKERGHANLDWLESHHSFSFGNYYDPDHMGFRALRVINEDVVKADEGFGTHPHKDMEIITYVLGGKLEHKDSMGTGATILPGEVQYMSAGKGVLHSEFNPAKDGPVHLLQIWILPNVKGAEPRYDQKNFPDSEKRGKLRLVVSPDGAEGSIEIRQDAKIYASLLKAGESVALALNPGRHAWIQVAKGSLEVNGTLLATGDGAAISQVAELKMKGTKDDTEFLVFDLS